MTDPCLTVWQIWAVTASQLIVSPLAIIGGWWLAGWWERRRAANPAVDPEDE
jgi:hypothetical protein